jgi:hypothetical protein
MLFFVFLSLLVMLDLLSLSAVASSAARLGRAHGHGSTFVDLDNVTSGVCAAREASEPSRATGDDRVGVGAGLDHVALAGLLVEERVETDSPRALRIDVAHESEYRKEPGSRCRSVRSPG